MSVQLALKATLVGHTEAVTCLAVPTERSDVFLSGSRDKTLIIWTLDPTTKQYGIPKQTLKGHTGTVSDCDISSDGQYAISASWDKTLRAWKVATDVSHKFTGHTAEVLSVCLSNNGHHIVSGSKDHSVKVWSMAGECKFTSDHRVHSMGVSAVRFSPNQGRNMIISAGEDKHVKIWDGINFRVMKDYSDHACAIDALAISPDTSFCASAGTDGTIIIYDLESSKKLVSLDAGNEVRALAFSPTRHWLCAGTSASVVVFDLEKMIKLTEMKLENNKLACCSVAWNTEGSVIFTGSQDGSVRAWDVLET